MEPKKSRKGGRRPGAGRPRLYKNSKGAQYQISKDVLLAFNKACRQAGLVKQSVVERLMMDYLKDSKGIEAITINTAADRQAVVYNLDKDILLAFNNVCEAKGLIKKVVVEKLMIFFVASEQKGQNKNPCS